MRKENSLPNTTEQSIREHLLEKSPKDDTEIKIETAPVEEKPSGVLNETSVFIRDPTSDGTQLVKDKFYLVYIIFLLFGVANLLPWNIFITATDYFVKYKLNTTESMNTTYRNDFTLYVGIIGQTTNVAMNLINILISFGGNPKNRIPYTIMLCAAVIVFHIFMAIIDSSTWPLKFFIFTCVSVFIMYVATGIMNSCIYYVSAIFPMEYINAIILGNNVAGIFTSVASIFSKVASPNLRIAAIIYFLLAFAVLMFAFVGYFLMHRTSFYHYYNERSEKARKEHAENSSERTQKVPYFLIIKQTWHMLFCIWLNFFSTLAIFPAFQLGILQSDPNFFVPSDYFNDVIIFLTFNISVTFGNMLPKLVRRPGLRFIYIPVIARAVIVFIFFALCNFKPTERGIIPILFSNDYVYWFGCILSPFAFGYFTSLLMMYTPQLVAQQHQGSASMIAAFMIAVGVMSGLYFSKIYEFIVLIKF